MHRLMIAIGLSTFLVIVGCEQQTGQEQAGQQPPAAVQEEQTAQQQPAQQPAGEPAEQEQQQKVTVQPGPEQSAQQPPGQDQQQQVTAQPDQEQPAGQPSDQEQQTLAQQQEQQQPPAGQAPDTAEFMGQAPKIEDAPETITLEAKNGNVTLPHREHAQRMDCKTCHGDAEPGPIAGFNKDKAHPLCQGCHKEQGAGPTKCAECHKKS